MDNLLENANTWNLPQISNIINQCDDLIAPKADLYKTGNNYENILLYTFTKAILNMREVITLLFNGYPDGALSRARTIYEQMVIVEFIDHNKDKSIIIDKYFADYNIKRLNNLIEVFEFLLTGDSNNEEFQKQKSELEFQYQSIKDKYNIKEKNVKQYWWAGDVIKNPSFNQLTKEVDTGFLKILYNRACLSSHSSAMGDSALLGRYNPLGNYIYTSPTLDGFEAPIVLSLGSFSEILKVCFDYLDSMCTLY